MKLPAPGHYGTGLIFVGKTNASEARHKFEALAKENGLKVVWWRDVPKNNYCLGEVAANTEPCIMQVSEI